MGLSREVLHDYNYGIIRTAFLNTLRRNPLSLCGKRLCLYRDARARLHWKPERSRDRTLFIQHFNIDRLLTLTLTTPASLPLEDMPTSQLGSAVVPLWRTWGIQFSLSVPRILLLLHGHREIWLADQNTLVDLLRDGPEIDWRSLLRQIHNWIVKILFHVLCSLGVPKNHLRDKTGYLYTLRLDSKPEVALDLPLSAGLNLDDLSHRLRTVFSTLDQNLGRRRHLEGLPFYELAELPGMNRIKAYPKLSSDGRLVLRFEFQGPCSTGSRMARWSRVASYDPVIDYMRQIQPFLAVLANDTLAGALSPQQIKLLEGLPASTGALLEAPTRVYEEDIRSYCLQKLVLERLLVRTPVRGTGYCIRAQALRYLRHHSFLRLQALIEHRRRATPPMSPGADHTYECPPSPLRGPGEAIGTSPRYLMRTGYGWALYGPPWES